MRRGEGAVDRGDGPGRQDGAVVVEFAIVFTLFITLLWGIFTYGVIFAVQQTVTHAAGEAARSTVGYSDFTEAQAVAHSVATEQLKWLGAAGAPALGDVSLGPCGTSAPGVQCVHVEYEYPWGTDPIISPLLNIGTPSVLRGTATITWDGS